MSLTNITQASLDEEEGIQNEIYTAIDDYQNILFNAGAGAGKTYALIESLKHILKKHGDRLQRHNQKVVCITYTNVAVDEIKGRIGHSEVVEVSTIHEKLWSFIRQHQKELLQIHKNKIEAVLIILNDDLNKNMDPKVEPKFKAFRALTKELKASFEEYMLENKSLFYKNYDKGAAGFRKVFGEYLNEYTDIIKSVGNFKKVVGTIYKIKNFEYCLQNIEEKTDGYTSVKYDSKYNDDILHKMLFSHDTLLEYARDIIGEYDLLKQIIIDSHPYILIDEYQDTNPSVVEIMQLLSTHSEKISHPVFIGYFGDKAQNIYDDGVGSEITTKHIDLKDVYKKFNRRSVTEIITVINKIRADGIVQKSIYEDSNGGSVEFYCSKAENKQAEIEFFISKYCDEWNISNEKKLHCLVLTNKLVAKLSGFPDLYQGFADSKYYKSGKKYQYLNTELLSDDLTKLGTVQSLLHKTVKLKVLLSDSTTPLTKLLSDEVCLTLTFSKLKELIDALQLITGETISDYLYSVFELYEKGNSDFRKVIDEIFLLEEMTYDKIYGEFFNGLNPNLDVDDTEVFDKSKRNLDVLLGLEFEQYRCWYNFVNNKQDSKVVYHTYHSTKGTEFENVVIIMENDFGPQGKGKFSSFFKNITTAFELNDDLLKHENTKNLLYVSCSRAIKNLRVLYLDDIKDFSHGIEHVFGKVRYLKDGGQA